MRLLSCIKFPKRFFKVFWHFFIRTCTVTIDLGNIEEELQNLGSKPVFTETIESSGVFMKSCEGTVS